MAGKTENKANFNDVSDVFGSNVRLFPESFLQDLTRHVPWRAIRVRNVMSSTERCSPSQFSTSLLLTSTSWIFVPTGSKDKRLTSFLHLLNRTRPHFPNSVFNHHVVKCLSIRHCPYVSPHCSSQFCDWVRTQQIFGRHRPGTSQPDRTRKGQAAKQSCSDCQ